MDEISTANQVDEQHLQDLLAEIAEANQRADQLDAALKRVIEGRPMIHERMVVAMRETGAVAKSGRNTQQGYSFRGIDGVLNAVGPALRKAGVFVTNEFLEQHFADAETTKGKATREVRLSVRFTFWAEDGSSISTTVTAESLDTSDKGLPKALSVAFRMALITTFALPTDDPTPDDDSEYHERGARRPGMTDTEREQGITIIQAAVPSLDLLVQFGSTVLQRYGAWHEKVNPNNPHTAHWSDAFSAAMRTSISAILTLTDARAAFEVLKAGGMLDSADSGSNQTWREALSTRAAAIKDEMAEAFDHCMAIITSATDEHTLRAADDHVTAEYEQGPITKNQLDGLRLVLADRRAAIAREAMLPAVGVAWDQLVGHLTRTGLTANLIIDALSGEYGMGATPAHMFGMDGLQRVIDAAKAARHRDGSITAEQYEEIAQAVRNHAELSGIAIPDGVL